MTYFVTGATGFIGRILVEQAARAQGHDLRAGAQGVARRSSTRCASELRRRRRSGIVAVIGDLAKPKLGVARARRARSSRARSKHFFHLAAIYDLAAERRSQSAANVDGTRHALEFADAINAGCFHHVSSIAAAGLYDGVFREDMFDEAEDLDHPYFRTKHDSEGARAQANASVPYRIYRPGIVVGHSKTGEIDKIDGPYYFFKLIQKMRETLPPWMPTIGIEGGRINIVPVDFVADALDHIAHKNGLDGHMLPPDRSRSRTASARC